MSVLQQGGVFCGEGDVTGQGLAQTLSQMQEVQQDTLARIALGTPRFHYTSVTRHVGAWEFVSEWRIVFVLGERSQRQMILQILEDLARQSKILSRLRSCKDYQDSSR